MSPSKLTPVSWRVLVKRLRELGFEGPFEGGKHPYMIRRETVLTLPNPHERDIGVALLSRLLRQAGISREQWLQSRRDRDGHGS
ncbi:MAG: type II toxin-antitoxin system HicA family toxin [Trueperaceae bacterium]|nr:MAG: type II toxin-antitoxin system HicA family toxin [Trueperaceae bacterium]